MHATVLTGLNLEGISHKAQVANAAGAQIALDLYPPRRLDRDRPSDLGLVRLLLGDPADWPTRRDGSIYRQVHPGVYTADLPPDAYKAVWITDAGFLVATYSTAGQRDGAVGL